MSSVEHDNMVGLMQSIISGEDQSLEVLRSAYDQLQQSFPMADDVEYEEIQIEHIYTDWVSVPESRDDSVIMYLHGGGYVIGSKSGYREFASRIARACKARVLVVEYRLAPEHVFPAALDDAVMAYRWLLNQGINSENITVFGDSAGGGLTLATLVALRDTGDALPKCAVCFSAWADLAGTGDSGKPGAVDDPVMNQEALDSFRDLYVGKDTRNPLASPLYANLSGLPPLCLFAGTREILIDDSRRMAENAMRDEVEVSLTIGEGMMHVWPVFPIPESIEVLSEVAEFVEAR
jgi:acetyl esterase/lipase